MPELIHIVPMRELFLYFSLYSFLGWCMETAFCSIRQHKLVPRGFLYGPVCPIYGAGVVLMITFFTPLKGSIPLFYVSAVVVMSSWEYFVSWLLEVTTHMKYWDYSDQKFNLNGRVCLWISLTWGVLSYLVIFWIHPPVERLVQSFSPLAQTILSSCLAIVFLVDTIFTIRSLVQLSKVLAELAAIHDELQVQLALGKAELQDRVEERAAALRTKYNRQALLVEKYSRRFRSGYSKLRVSRKFQLQHHQIHLEDILTTAKQAKENLDRKIQQGKEKLQSGIGSNN